MMGYFAAVSAVLSIANLALSLALIRWVRHHGEQHAAQRTGAAPSARLPVGTVIPEFTTTTVSGVDRSMRELRGARSVVAFLSVGCPPCRDQIGEFREFARTIPGGPSQVLAVIANKEADPDMAAEFITELGPVAWVATEARRGPAQTAFSVRGFPSYFVLDEHGQVETSAPAMSRLSVTEHA
jgi:Redoxin